MDSALHSVRIPFLLFLFESFQLGLTVWGALTSTCLFLLFFFYFLSFFFCTAALEHELKLTPSAAVLQGCFGTTQMSNTHWTNARKGRGPPPPTPPPPPAAPLFCLLMSISGRWSFWASSSSWDHDPPPPPPAPCRLVFIRLPTEGLWTFELRCSWSNITSQPDVGIVIYGRGLGS